MTMSAPQAACDFYSSSSEHAFLVWWSVAGGDAQYVRPMCLLGYQDTGVYSERGPLLSQSVAAPHWHCGAIDAAFSLALSVFLSRKPPFPSHPLPLHTSSSDTGMRGAPTASRGTRGRQASSYQARRIATSSLESPPWLALPAYLLACRTHIRNLATCARPPTRMHKGHLHVQTHARTNAQGRCRR